MRVTLPTLRKEFDEKTEIVKVIKDSIECDIDTSIYSETRWEKTFPDTAKNYKLFDYIQMLTNAKGTVDGRVYVSSLLKAVYCFIESDDLPTFKSFCKLFDLSDEEFSIGLIKKIQHIFELILQASSTKN